MFKSVIENNNIFAIAEEIFHLFRSGMRLKTPLGWGDHKECWGRLNDALETDNPEWGLLAAWGILENQAELVFGDKLRPMWGGRTDSILKETIAHIDMNPAQAKKLKSTTKKRNAVAHGSPTNVDWSDVDIVLSAAYRLHKS